MNEEEYVERYIIPALRKKYPGAKIYVPNNRYYKNRRPSKTHPDIVIEHSPKHRVLSEFKKILNPNYPSICDITGKGIFGQIYTWIELEKKYNKTEFVSGMPILALLPIEEYGETMRENVSTALKIIYEHFPSLLIFNHRTKRFEDVSNWSL